MNGETLIKAGGILLFVVGVILMLSSIGLPLFAGLGFLGPIWTFIVGIVFIAFGIFIYRGGRPTL